MCFQTPEGKQRALDDKKNKEIQKDIVKEQSDLAKNQQVKLLLLGAGQSGKSTVLKQLRLMYHPPYTAPARMEYRNIIFGNVVASIQCMLIAMHGKLQLPLPHELLPAKAVVLGANAFNVNAAVFKSVVPAIIALLECHNVQLALERRDEYQIGEAVPLHFLPKLKELAEDGYIPTNEDILHSRVRTTGITEDLFQVEKHLFRVLDVGGQRSQQKKWIQCFQDVTAVVFIVAISEYDQFLEEDETQRRFDEAIRLFDSVCNSRWFSETSIIVFFNKCDIFEKKLAKQPMEKYIEEFRPADFAEHANYVDKCKAFMKKKFTDLNKNPAKKDIETMFTTATSETIMRKILRNVNKIILYKLLRVTGLITTGGNH